eukprot:352743-Chlamydomonas_euryale.AAC.14
MVATGCSLQHVVITWKQVAGWGTINERQQVSCSYDYLLTFISIVTKSKDATSNRARSRRKCRKATYLPQRPRSEAENRDGILLAGVSQSSGGRPQSSDAVDREPQGGVRSADGAMARLLCAQTNFSSLWNFRKASVVLLILLASVPDVVRSQLSAPLADDAHISFDGNKFLENTADQDISGDTQTAM